MFLFSSAITLPNSDLTEFKSHAACRIYCDRWVARLLSWKPEQSSPYPEYEQCWPLGLHEQQQFQISISMHDNRDAGVTPTLFWRRRRADAVLSAATASCKTSAAAAHYIYWKQQQISHISHTSQTPCHLKTETHQPLFPTLENLTVPYDHFRLWSRWFVPICLSSGDVTYRFFFPDLVYNRI